MLTKRIGKFGKVNRVKILFVLFDFFFKYYPPPPSASVGCILPSHLCHDFIGKCVYYKKKKADYNVVPNRMSASTLKARI